MSADADSALARRAAEGDRAAFEALVRRHHDSLHGFVRRYLGGSDEARDVLQETFVSAWRAIQSFDPQRSFATWLRAIALNKCRDLARRARTRRLFHRAWAEQPPPPPPVAPDDGDEAMTRRLDRAIARLPERYKDPLLLTTAGGLSHQEAAALLGVSAKAVEMRLYRARRQLLEMMDEPEG